MQVLVHRVRTVLNMREINNKHYITGFFFFKFLGYIF